MDHKISYDDCTVIVGTRPYKLNRFVFARHSHYFAEEMLKYEENPLLEMNLPDIPYSVFDLIILWMDGKNIEPGLTKIGPLWEAAVQLSMPGLQQYVEAFIYRLFKTMCPATVYDNLILTGNQGFKLILRTIYASLFYEIVENKFFPKFSLKQVCKLLSLDELRIHSEKEMMITAFQWLNYKWEKRRCHLPKILEFIRFDRLSDIELDKLYDDPQLAKFMTFPECEQMMMDTWISRAKGRQNSEWNDPHPPQKSHSALGTFHNHISRHSKCWRNHPQITCDRSYHATCLNMSANRRTCSMHSCPGTHSIYNHDHSQHQFQLRKRQSSECLFKEISIRRDQTPCLQKQRDCGDSRLVAGGNQSSNFRISSEHFANKSKIWNEAAVRIQSFFIGQKTREKYKTMRKAAIKIQSVYRGYKTRKQLLQNLKQGILILGGTNPSSAKHNQDIERQILYFNGDHPLWTTLCYKPDCRHHAAYALLDHKIYMSGGSKEIKEQSNGGLVASNHVESFDLRTGKWEEVAKMLFPRIHHCLVDYKGRLYAIGGLDDRGNLLRAVEYFLGGRWRAVSPIKSPRMAVAAAVCGGGLWILGGIGILKDGKTYNIKKTVEFYDTQKDRWEERPYLRQPRCFASAAAKDSHLYIIGGAREGKSRPGWNFITLDEIDVLDVSVGQWSTLTHLPISRFNCASVILGEYLFVMGGVSAVKGRTLQSVDKLNLDTKEWSTDTPPLPQPLTGMGALPVSLPNWKVFEN